MSPESKTGKLIALQVNTLVRRNSLMIAGVLLLVHFATAAAMWTGLAARADAATAAAAQRAGGLEQSVARTGSDVNRLQTAVVDKLLQSERLAAAAEVQDKQPVRRLNPPGGLRAAGAPRVAVVSE
jgi:hypothetical protein